MTRRLSLFLLSLLLAGQAVADTITCLGRIEPFDGVRVLAGPSGFTGASAVIAELRVEEGDWVEANQILAVLDDYRLRETEAASQSALLEEAQVDLQRLQNLAGSRATSVADLDKARFKLSALQAERRVFQARLEMSLIRAPMRSQVLKIHTREGEKVGPEGILELGVTDKMTVVAEVYETDVDRLAEGQTAIITSPALSEPAEGKVLRVGYRVGKMDVLGSDPIADTDSRVVEAIILMDDPTPFERLTNLQVDVEILP